MLGGTMGTAGEAPRGGPVELPPHRYDGAQLQHVGPDGAEMPFTDPLAERRTWSATLNRTQARLLSARRQLGQPTLDDLALDPNPPIFVRAVEEFLAPTAGAFNETGLRSTYLAVATFLGWAAIADAYRPLAGARVYSSGCGVGGSLVAYHCFGARSVVGSEVDDGLTFLAHLRTRSLPGVQMVRIDTSRPLPFADASFDVIESLDVIEHVEDLVAYTAEIGRVLAPGGIALVAAPNRMFPVEQHTGVRWITWAPFRLGNLVARTLARLPWVAATSPDRLLASTTVRTGNVSWRTIEQMAVQIGAQAVRAHRLDHPAWPVRPDTWWVERMARLRLLGGLAPTRQVVGILQKPSALTRPDS